MSFPVSEGVRPGTSRKDPHPHQTPFQVSFYQFDEVPVKRFRDGPGPHFHLALDQYAPLRPTLPPDGMRGLTLRNLDLHPSTVTSVTPTMSARVKMKPFSDQRTGSSTGLD